MPKYETPSEFRLKLGTAGKGDPRPRPADRRTPRPKPAAPPIAARTVVRALKATAGAAAIIERVPGLGDFKVWAPVASFTVCQKTGTATFLDIWDADHFDGFTDMQRCLGDCRAWFAADGFTAWDSPQTKTGRINCYFRAPAAGNYVCNAQLQSHAGPALVECLIDNFSYGPLPFNGSINQPHPATLGEGFHHFRIRQLSGSFFFNSLTVWRV